MLIRNTNWSLKDKNFKLICDHLCESKTEKKHKLIFVDDAISIDYLSKRSHSFSVFRKAFKGEPDVEYFTICQASF